MSEANTPATPRTPPPRSVVGGDHLGPESPSTRVPSYDLTEYRVLKVWAEMFFDAQEHRKAITNRVERAPVYPDIFAAELRAARQAEERIGRELVKQFKKTAPPGVIAWQAETAGIGLHGLAQLLGHLGHPRIATPSHWEGSGSKRKLIPDPPYERTIAQLWQYCGHGRPGKPQRGMSAEDLAALGSPMLKMVLWRMAEPAMRQPGRTLPEEAIATATTDADAPPPGEANHSSEAKMHAPRRKSRQATAGPQSNEHAPDDATEAITQSGSNRLPPLWPLRAVYEHRRIATAERVHAEPCVRCGPSGRPALPDSPWSAKHRHADAIRIVGKEILRSLWLVS